VNSLKATSHIFVGWARSFLPTLSLNGGQKKDLGGYVLTLFMFHDGGQAGFDIMVFFEF